MGMAPMQGQQPMPGLQGLAGLLQGLMGRSAPPPMQTTMPVPPPGQRVQGGPEDFAQRVGNLGQQTQPAPNMRYTGWQQLEQLRNRQRNEEMQRKAHEVMQLERPELDQGLGGREDLALPGTGQSYEDVVAGGGGGFNPVMAHREDGTPVRLGDRNEAGEPEWATMLGELTKYGTPQRADDTGMFPPPPPAPPPPLQSVPPLTPSTPPPTPPQLDSWARGENEHMGPGADNSQAQEDIARLESLAPKPPASTPPPPGQIGGPTPLQNKPAFEGGPDPQSSIPPRPPPWAPSVPEPRNVRVRSALVLILKG